MSMRDATTYEDLKVEILHNCVILKDELFVRWKVPFVNAVRKIMGVEK